MLGVGVILTGCSQWGEIDNYELVGIWELTHTAEWNPKLGQGALEEFDWEGEKESVTGLAGSQWFVKYKSDGAGMVYCPNINEDLKQKELIIYNILYSFKNGILRERRECKYLKINEKLELRVMELTPSSLILEQQKVNKKENYFTVYRSWYKKREELPNFTGYKKL
jgi:hypothetical protein